MPCRSSDSCSVMSAPASSRSRALAHRVGPPHQPGDVLGLAEAGADRRDQGGLGALQDPVALGVGQHHAALDRPRVEGGHVDRRRGRRGAPALNHWKPRSQRKPSITSVPTRPPTRAERSSTRTDRPDCSNARAQVSPATPAPITATSVASIAGEYHPAGAGGTRRVTIGPLGMDHAGTPGPNPPICCGELTRRAELQDLVERRARLGDRAAAGRRGSVRAPRRTPAASRPRRPGRTARRTRAGAGRGCRRASASAAGRRRSPSTGADPRVGEPAGSSDPAQNDA